MATRFRTVLFSTGLALLLALALLFSPLPQARAAGSHSASLELVAQGFAHPVVLEEAPDGSGRLFIVDQTGQIWIRTTDGSLLAEPFLDVQDRMVEINPGYDERGLLGLAFHPDYASNGRFFVYYSAPLRDSAPDDWDHTSHLSEFHVSHHDPNVADAASEIVLMEVDQPQSNHDGGTLAFGPMDGYLYISLGDGGGRDDEGTGHVDDWYAFNTGGNGQDIEQNLLGSILRIDVNGASPYEVPADNPFVGILDSYTEQYAYGFRNPFRFSFDMGGDHAMYVGDAGQDMYEEVNIVGAGGNYGWNVKEGTHCFDAANPTSPPDSCPDVVGAGHPLEGAPLLDPVIEFLNSNQEGGLGLAVVGGYVYRGTLLPELDGYYVFGSWSRGVDETSLLGGGLWVADSSQPATGLWNFEALTVAGDADGQLDPYLLSFAQDQSGEVYVLTTEAIGPEGDSGNVYRLAPPDETAVTLSELGSAPPSRMHGAGLALLGLTVAAGLLALRRRR